MTLEPYEDEEFIDYDQAQLDKLDGIKASLDQLASQFGEMSQVFVMLAEAIKYTGRPKKIVRGPDGRAAGVE